MESETSSKVFDLGASSKVLDTPVQIREISTRSVAHRADILVRLNWNIGGLDRDFGSSPRRGKVVSLG